MAKRTTRKYTQQDLIEIVNLIKSEKTSYGVAGAPLEQTTNVAKKRTVAYGENRAYNFRNTFSLSSNKRGYKNKKPSFKECELIAETNPILRIGIEYVKSGVSNTSFSFVDKNTNEETEACKAVKSFFEFPDSDNDFKSWIKQLVEDILVTDTACIYNEINANKKSLRVQIVDGTLVQPIVNERGIVPLTGTAYQMKDGKDITNFTRDELIYYPTNKRTKQKFGFSKVAQAYQIATLFDKEMNEHHDHYDGNISNVIATIKNLGTGDIKALDALLGYYEEQRNDENKYDLSVFPEATFHNLKQVDLKSSVHDFYIRIICAIFNVPYQYFVAEVNRATAETSQSITEQKGLRDILDNVEAIINIIIRRFLKDENVIFKFVMDVPVDPNKLADRLATLVNSKLITVNEARLELGYPSVPGGDELSQVTPMSPAQEQDDDQVKLDDDMVKSELKKSERNPEVEEAFKVAEKEFTKVFDELLTSQKQAILNAVESGATIDESLLALLNISDEQAEIIVKAFSAISKKLGVTFLSSIQNQFNINDLEVFEKTIEELDLYNTERSAELIGKRKVNGKFIDNPNKSYAITETTRESVKRTINKAMQLGTSNQDLAKELESLYDFSSDRAMLIAVTETNQASNFTAKKSYELAGIKKVEWSTTYNDNKVCESCMENEKQGGIYLGQAFKSGVFQPPAHPRCRCTLNPVM